MKTETKDKIKNGLTYLLIAIVYVTYTLNVSFMISSWVLPTTVVVPFWSMEELIVWIALMGIFTTMFFGMIYTVWKLGKRDRKNKKFNKTVEVKET